MFNLIMQAAPGAGGGAIGQLVMLGLIAVIFYMLLIRPQNQRMKKHRQMLSEIQRGDEIVTGGGLVGKVIKVTDDRLMVDMGEGLKLKVVRSMVADVLNRTEPANDRPVKEKVKK